MIVLRKQKKFPLILISEIPNLQNELILPKVPKDLISVKKGELQNSKLPRIRLFKNVGDAISGTFLDRNIKGKKFYVYQGKHMRPDNTYEPELPECPTLLKIPEIWYLAGLEVDCIGEIEILGPEKTETYHYGPRQTTGRFIRWKWKEILKPWEKRGKLR